jgi:hypothetical protein
MMTYSRSWHTAQGARHAGQKPVNIAGKAGGAQAKEGVKKSTTPFVEAALRRATL